MYPFVHVNFLSSFVVPPSTAQAELFIHPSVHTSTHPSSLYLWIYLSIYLHTPSSCFHEFIHTLMHFHTHTHLLSFLTSLPPPLPCFSQSSLNTIHPHIKHSSLLTMSIHKCVHPLILWSFFSSSFLSAHVSNPLPLCCPCSKESLTLPCFLSSSVLFGAEDWQPTCQEHTLPWHFPLTLNRSYICPMCAQEEGIQGWRTSSQSGLYGVCPLISCRQ